MSGGALTYEMVKRLFDQCEQAPRGPDVFVVSPGTLRVIQIAGQREARQQLSELCAATRPIFGDILVWDYPEPGKAGRWWMCGGPWPYTAPNLPPPPIEDTWLSLKRDTTNWWRSCV